MTTREERLARLRSLPPERRALLMQVLASRRQTRLRDQAETVDAYLHDTCVTPARRGPVAPQSFAQRRLWFLDRLVPRDPAYNMPECVRLSGAVDLDRLRRCFQRIVARHEILRTTFEQRDGEPVQVAAPHLEVDIEFVDLSKIHSAKREVEARRLLFVHSERPFDLRTGPLARLTLFRLEERHHFLLLNMHHIVSDGWSTGVFIAEFTALYEAELRGTAAPLADLPVQYADYAIWQQHRLEGEVLQAQVAYWVGQLAGVPDLVLPRLPPRGTAPPSSRGGFQSIVISRAELERIRSFAVAEGATLFMLLVAGFKTLLHRHTGQVDLTVGTPIAGRSRRELEPLIGLLANTLALRTTVSASEGFREALRREREAAVMAFAHQDAPFEKVVEALKPERTPGRNPIFQVMLILQNTPMPRLELPGLKFEMLAAGTLSVKFDMLFELYETARGLEGWLGYRAEVLEESFVARFATRYVAWLTRVIEEPDRPIEALPLAATEEIARLADDFSANLDA